MPKISIVVPVYKVEEYISECIESILAQTFSDIEIILVDDGSPDSCPTICDEYARRDNRITVIHKNNEGVATARNAGLKLAQGEYVMFCDSDDYVHPDWCKIFFELAEKNPGAWIFCNMYKVTNDKLSASISDLKELESVANKPSYYKAFKNFLSGSSCNKIYKLDVLRRNNIYFDKSKRICEDACFDAQYVRKCNKVIFIKEPLYYYRYNEDSATNTYRSDWMESHLCAFALRRTIVSNEELPLLCDEYLKEMLFFLNNTFDKQNKKSFFEKMRYNHKMINDEEFKICVANATGKNDSVLFMKILRLHNYYIYWAFQKLCILKNKLFKHKAG